jgi:type IV pilus assembly protein PilE
MIRKKQLGFTLIELMIVVVIISIIMAYIIPNYREYVLKSRRTEANNSLIAMAAIQERFYANNNRYGTAAEVNMATLYPAPTDANGLFYTISMESTDTSYTITSTASGRKRQNEDTPCLVMTLDNLGQKTPTGDECWR